VQQTDDYRKDEKCIFRWWTDSDWKVHRLSGGMGKSRELWASSAEMFENGHIPDGFHGKPGDYQLEWSAPAAMTCLNARHPRVHVYAYSSGYKQLGGLIRLMCMFLAGTGIVLVMRALGSWIFGYFFGNRSLRMFPEVALRHVTPWK
jgi:hypothetical protein